MARSFSVRGGLIRERLSEVQHGIYSPTVFTATPAFSKDPLNDPADK